MTIIARGNGFSIDSSVGRSVAEGTVSSGSEGSGSTVTFTFVQSPVQLRTVYVQVVPINGQTGDFWDNFWSNRIGGEPADQFALSAFVGVDTAGQFTITLNADRFQEGDEVFEVRVYESNMDAAWGVSPLVTGRFTILDDDIIGTAGSDQLSGRDHAENLFGGAGSDYLDGAGGNDTLNGGIGADTLVGGAGDDTFFVDNAEDRVVEGTNAGTDRVLSSLAYTLGANLENLTLTGTTHINGTGNALANQISGNAGNNVLNGGLGVDTMRGGAGNDTYIVDHLGDRVFETLNAGVDRVQSSVSFTLDANVEHLTLIGTANLNGTGNALANQITGNAGNNLILGGQGADNIQGGAGSDTLNGGQGNDILIGDAGVDRIIGGQGADRMTGSTGADVFVFQTLADSTTALAGRDIITDLSFAQGDRIDLSALDARANAVGNQAFSFIGTGNFTGNAGELAYRSVAAGTLIVGDVNGDRVADLAIFLDDSLTLNANSFIL